MQKIGETQEEFLNRILSERTKEAQWAQENADRRKRQKQAQKSFATQRVTPGTTEDACSTLLQRKVGDASSQATRESSRVAPSTRCGTAVTQVGARLTAANLLQHRVLSRADDEKEKQELIESCTSNKIVLPTRSNDNTNKAQPGNNTQLPPIHSVAFQQQNTVHQQDRLEGTLTSRRSSSAPTASRSARRQHSSSRAETIEASDGYGILRLLKRKQDQQANIMSKEAEQQQQQQKVEEETNKQKSEQRLDHQEHHDRSRVISLPPLAPTSKPDIPPLGQHLSNKPNPSARRPPTPRLPDSGVHIDGGVKPRVDCGAVKRKHRRNVHFNSDLTSGDAFVAPDGVKFSVEPNAVEVEPEATTEVSADAATATTPPRHSRLPSDAKQATRSALPRLPTIYDAIKELEPSARRRNRKKASEMAPTQQQAQAAPKPLSMLQKAKAEVMALLPTPTKKRGAHIEPGEGERRKDEHKSQPDEVLSSPIPTGSDAQPKRSLFGKVLPRAQSAVVRSPKSNKRSHNIQQDCGTITVHGGGIGVDADGNICVLPPAIMQVPEMRTKTFVQREREKEQHQADDHHITSRGLAIDDDLPPDFEDSWEPRSYIPEPMAALRSTTTALQENTHHHCSPPPQTETSRQCSRAGTATAERSSSRTHHRSEGYASRFRGACQTTYVIHEETENVTPTLSPAPAAVDEEIGERRQFGQVRSLNTGWTWKERQLIEAIETSNARLKQLQQQSQQRHCDENDEIPLQCGGE